MKKSLIALTSTVLALSLNTLPAYAEKPPAKPKIKHEASKQFFQNLAHASFMPNIMKHIKQNRSKLKITEQQMAELQKYHQANSPIVHEMVAALMQAEKRAREMTLDNFPPDQVATVGRKSIQIRHDLMMRKLQCRSFIKTVLSPEQYKEALTSYK